MRTRSPMLVRSLADGVGVLSSAICVVHCLATPALLVAGTALVGLFESDEFFHRAVLWTILPSATVAFGLGCWHHKDRTVLVLGALGLVGLSLSATVLHHLLGETGERMVSLAAASVLIAAHLRNFTLCRSDRCDHG